MFATIQHIDDVRPHVDANSESFYIADKGDYLVANYKSIMAAFPDLAEGMHARILRECRGIIFCGKTGKILRRPLHKFFNYGERTEYHPSIMAEKTVVAVYDKLDGSMIAPFMLDGKVRWGTKMGLTHMTPDVEAFVAKNLNYEDFAIMMLAVDVQLIFEYMAPKHRIVVDHSEEKMVLLAMRHMITGEYYDYDTIVKCAAAHNVPVVRRWEVDDSRPLVDQVREMEGEEGVVVEFDDGTRCKIKSLWYMDLHKNREAIAKEKYVVGLILNDRIDDALGLVPDFVVPRLQDYTLKFMGVYEAKCDEVVNYVLRALTTYDQKRDYAIATASEGNHLARTIAFKVYDGQATTQEIPGVIVDMFKERILAFTDKSDTDFEKLCRKAVFDDQLPEWNIWESVPTEE